MEGEDYENLSHRELSQRLLNGEMLDNEAIVKRGNDETLTVNLNALTGINKMRSTRPVLDLMQANGYDVSLGFENIEGTRRDRFFIKDNKTGKEWNGPVSLTYNSLYNKGIRTNEQGGYSGFLDETLTDLALGKQFTDYRIWEDKRLNNEADVRGLYKLLELGEDPAKIIKPTDWGS